MKENKKVKFSIIKNLNKPILILTILFAVIGAFLILDASSISSVLTYRLDTPYYFFIRQLKFIGGALILSSFILLFPTKYYRFVSFILSVGFIILLASVYIKNSLFSSSVNDVTLSLFNGK